MRRCANRARNIAQRTRDEIDFAKEYHHIALQQPASIVHLVRYPRSGAQTWRIALRQRRDTAESEGHLILMIFTFLCGKLQQ